MTENRNNVTNALQNIQTGVNENEGQYCNGFGMVVVSCVIGEWKSFFAMHLYIHVVGTRTLQERSSTFPVEFGPVSVVHVAAYQNEPELHSFL